MKALIIEDDQREQEFLRNALSELGYACTVEEDGETGFDRLLGETYDLALVDIMLPHMDGKEIICQARAAIATNVRQNREHFKRQSPFNIGKVDNGVFQIIHHQHEKNT